MLESTTFKFILVFNTLRQVLILLNIFLIT